MNPHFHHAGGGSSHAYAHISYILSSWVRTIYTVLLVVHVLICIGRGLYVYLLNAFQVWKIHTSTSYSVAKSLYKVDWKRIEVACNNSWIELQNSSTSSYFSETTQPAWSAWHCAVTILWNINGVHVSVHMLVHVHVCIWYECQPQCRFWSQLAI